MFSLVPQSAGTPFASANSAVNFVSAANNTAYWSTDTQIWSDSLNDTTGGTAKTALPSIPFGGVTISDLAVDPAANLYQVAWNAPGFGWFIAQYPLAPSSTNFSIFTNNTTLVHGLSIVGDKTYWLEGMNILSQNLDGTGKTQVQSFNFGTVTLNDLAVDPASQTYLLAATTDGIPPLIARYPLTPNSSGNLFAFANNNVVALTLANNRAYWIEGANVWSENLNGTDLQLQETFAPGITPTDLAIAADAPEPLTASLCGLCLLTLATIRKITSSSAPTR